MSALVWAAVLLTLTASMADTDASVLGKKTCLNGFCITLKEDITADTGLSVMLPCSFTVADGFTPQTVVWYKCEPFKERCGDPDIIFRSNDKNVESGFRGRLSMLEPDVSKMNCSIVVHDLRKSDSGSYQLRVTGLLNNRTDGFAFIPRINIFVKDATTWGKQECLQGYCITLKEEEITAEAGLCVMLPCSFTVADGFTPQTVVWYKCEPSKERCEDPDIIFRSNDKNVQSGFRGRLSMLEPDVSQMNCSIVVNDLRKSDSGSYQLRVTGLLNDRTDAFTFIPRINVFVKDLKQKPRVVIPPLTVRQQSTLTCTAPALCSGSQPEITWMWRGAGEDSHIPGNITAVHTENLAAFSQRHSSSLTFNLSAEHHNTNITCRIRFTEKTATEETVTLNMSFVKEVQIIGDRDVKEGGTLNLTCNVDSFPPSLVMWTKHNSCINLPTNTGSATFIISNVTAEHSGLYICTTKYMNRTWIKYADISVKLNFEKHCGSWCGVVPWTVAGVSLVVNVFCIILSYCLWRTRQKVKPEQEDKTYMTMQKSKISPDYDVIAQRQRQ